MQGRPMHSRAEVGAVFAAALSAFGAPGEAPLPLLPSHLVGAGSWGAAIDPAATDRAYRRSLWYRPDEEKEPTYDRTAHSRCGWIAVHRGRDR